MQNILVIFGGKTVEHDISIITGMGVMKNISVKYNTIPVYINKNGEFMTGELYKNARTYTGKSAGKKCYLLPPHNTLYIKSGFGVQKINVDCAVLALHGGEYEGGAIQGLLELCEIPYVGANVCASSICMDKTITKLCMNELNIKTAKYTVVREEDKQNLAVLIKKLEFPLIVKPARCGSSIGIKIVQNFAELEEATKFAFDFDNKLLIEEALTDFRELNISAFKEGQDIKLSSIEEVKFTGSMFSYDEKYIDKKVSRTVPADLDRSIVEKINKFAEKAYRKLDLSGIVRMDFLLKDDVAFLNEINTIPGSLAYYLWREQGYNFARLLDINIKQAIHHKTTKTLIYHTDVLKDLDNIDKIIEK